MERAYKIIREYISRFSKFFNCKFDLNKQSCGFEKNFGLNLSSKILISLEQ